MKKSALSLVEILKGYGRFAKIIFMPNLVKRINAFTKLGEVLMKVASDDLKYEEKSVSLQTSELITLIQNSQQYNGWFTEENVRNMIGAIGISLTKDKINQWLTPYYPLLEVKEIPKTIAVVMAGNVPAVGFHDLLCVLVSGNRLTARLSGDDNKLIPAIVDLLCHIEPEFNGMCDFTEDRLKDFDAVIATGSDNTSRYFEYYFGKYKHIIRKNRNGIAVLKGDETEKDLEGLKNDIFTYYGLGCRNVSKLMLPAGYDFSLLFNVLPKDVEINNNHKYFNNYEYNKAIYLVNGTSHYDFGNLLMVENTQIPSPVSVVNYEYYNSEKAIMDYLNKNSENIQCVVSKQKSINSAISFGKTQQPELWDYADGVDTMAFLLSLK